MKQGPRRGPRRGNPPHEARGSRPGLNVSLALLKRRENLGDEQYFRLRDRLRYNLRTVRAYLLKDAIRQL
jgi:hypothetical protein